MGERRCNGRRSRREQTEGPKQETEAASPGVGGRDRRRFGRAGSRGVAPPGDGIRNGPGSRKAAGGFHQKAPVGNQSESPRNGRQRPVGAGFRQQGSGGWERRTRSRRRRERMIRRASRIGETTRTTTKMRNMERDFPPHLIENIIL